MKIKNYTESETVINELEYILNKLYEIEDTLCYNCKEISICIDNLQELLIEK